MAPAPKIPQKFNINGEGFFKIQIYFFNYDIKWFNDRLDEGVEATLISANHCNLLPL